MDVKVRMEHGVILCVLSRIRLSVVLIIGLETVIIDDCHFNDWSILSFCYDAQHG